MHRYADCNSCSSCPNSTDSASQNSTHFTSCSLSSDRFSSWPTGRKYRTAHATAIVAPITNEISHQQLWNTPSAASCSPRAISMVISLPATDPNPIFEKLRYVGVAVRIPHTPNIDRPQKCISTGTWMSWITVDAALLTSVVANPTNSRRLVRSSITHTSQRKHSRHSINPNSIAFAVASLVVILTLSRAEGEEPASRARSARPFLTLAARAGPYFFSSVSNRTFSCASRSSISLSPRRCASAICTRTSRDRRSRYCLRSVSSAPSTFDAEISSSLALCNALASSIRDTSSGAASNGFSGADPCTSTSITAALPSSANHSGLSPNRSAAIWRAESASGNTSAHSKIFSTSVTARGCAAFTLSSRCCAACFNSCRIIALSI